MQMDDLRSKKWPKTTHSILAKEKKNLKKIRVSFTKKLGPTFQQQIFNF